MSEEEKKAIEIIKKMLYMFSESEELKLLLNLINLIEKQQKEIEELKNSDLTTVYLNGFYDGEKKWKDKIREKIKKYDEWIKEGGDYVESLEAQRYALNELLEE